MGGARPSCMQHIPRGFEMVVSLAGCQLGGKTTGRHLPQWGDQPCPDSVLLGGAEVCLCAPPWPSAGVRTAPHARLGRSGDSARHGERVAFLWPCNVSLSPGYMQNSHADTGEHEASRAADHLQ